MIPSQIHKTNSLLPYIDINEVIVTIPSMIYYLRKPYNMVKYLDDVDGVCKDSLFIQK